MPRSDFQNVKKSFAKPHRYTLAEHQFCYIPSSECTRGNPLIFMEEWERREGGRETGMDGRKYFTKF